MYMTGQYDIHLTPQIMADSGLSPGMGEIQPYKTCHCYFVDIYCYFVKVNISGAQKLNK